MQSRNPLFEDLARLLSSAAGTFAGAGREAETGFRERVRSFLADDFVARDEFEAVRTMAINARNEVDRLRGELETLRRGGARASPPPDPEPPLA